MAGSECGTQTCGDWAMLREPLHSKCCHHCQLGPCQSSSLPVSHSPEFESSDLCLYHRRAVRQQASSALDVPLCCRACSQPFGLWGSSTRRQAAGSAPTGASWRPAAEDGRRVASQHRCRQGGGECPQLLPAGHAAHTIRHVLKVQKELALSPSLTSLPHLQLLEAVAPLKRGLAANAEDKARIDKLASALERRNPTKKPLASELINGGPGLKVAQARSTGRAAQAGAA